MKRSKLLLLVFAVAPSAWASEWEPVDPADLAMTQSRIDPEADGEILFSRTTVKEWEGGAQGRAGNHLETYVRLKLFTEAGVEKQARIRVSSFLNRSRIKELEARIIQPDGSIVELDQEALLADLIEEKETESLTWKIYRIPGVVAGSIIEYRKVEYHSYISWSRVDYLQQDLPAREIQFEIHPVEDWSWQMPLYFNSYIMNAPGAEKESIQGKAFRVTLRDVPARGIVHAVRADKLARIRFRGSARRSQTPALYPGAGPWRKGKPVPKPAGPAS